MIDLTAVRTLQAAIEELEQALAAAEAPSQLPHKETHTASGIVANIGTLVHTMASAVQLSSASWPPTECYVNAMARDELMALSSIEEITALGGGAFHIRMPMSNRLAWLGATLPLRMHMPEGTMEIQAQQSPRCGSTRT